jgi:hypothetical protein
MKALESDTDITAFWTSCDGSTRQRRYPPCPHETGRAKRGASRGSLSRVFAGEIDPEYEWIPPGRLVRT